MTPLELAHQALEDDKLAMPAAWVASDPTQHVNARWVARWLAAAPTREPILAAEVVRLHQFMKDCEADDERLLAERDALKAEVRQAEKFRSELVAENEHQDQQLAAVKAALREACEMWARVIDSVQVTLSADGDRIAELAKVGEE